MADLFNTLEFSETDKIKFEPLRKYFCNIDIEDLANLGSDKLIEIAKDEDILLMNIFAYRVRDKFKEWACYANIFKPMVNNTGREILRPAKFLAYPQRMKEYDFERLTRSILESEYTYYIIHLNENSLPSLLEKFQKIQELIIELASSEKASFIDVSDMIVYSPHLYVEFIHSILSSDRIIWIKKESLSSDHWKTIIRDHEAEKIYELHKRYYAASLEYISWKFTSVDF